jgi:hypothetical protein
MRPTDLLRSSTFRLAISYMVVFAGSVLLLLGFIYWSTVSFIMHQTNASIKTEITWLAELYHEKGMESLVSTVAERSRGNNRSDSLYAVSGPGKKILAGNLLGLPEADQGKDGWMNFSYGDFRAADRLLQIRGTREHRPAAAHRARTIVGVCDHDSPGSFRRCHYESSCAAAYRTYQSGNS